MCTSATDDSLSRPKNEKARANESAAGFILPVNTLLLFTFLDFV